MSDTATAQSDSKAARSQTQPVITMRDVGKVFQSKRVQTTALDGIHLDIQAGEYIAISGPSGCGKSTLLSLIGLLDSPTSGNYLLNGDSVIGLSAIEKSALRNQHLGFVFQNFNLIGDLTVFRNIELPLTYRGIPSQQRAEMVMEALERVNLSDRADFYPAQLSGGQQQRVSVARACVTKPKLLLADEPTGNLDTQHGREIMNLLNRSHEEGATVILVTHDPRYVDFASRKISLIDGMIVDETNRK